MQIHISDNPQALGKCAAEFGAARIREVLNRKGEATLIVATGTSQFETLSHLIAAPDLDWSRITAFHLDEYIGIDAEHPASFRRYLRERFVEKVPLKAFHYLNGEGDAVAECRRVGQMIAAQSVDVAFVGIGENGHLAFNDPPADFETREPYLVVELDEACRKQQLGEGWFPTLDSVPRQAISMSVQEIMRADCIVCSVPDERKSTAVANTVEGSVKPEVPASILQGHADMHLYADRAAAAKLSS